MSRKCINLIMGLPVLAGVLIYSVSSLDLRSTAWAQVDFGFSDDGSALGIFEDINHLPLAAYNHFHPENYLPRAEDKRYAPVKKADFELSVDSSSSLVMDTETEEVLWANNQEQVRSIASISKLMSALVFLDSVPDWSMTYKIKKSDIRVGGRTYVYEGEEMTVDDLFHLALVASDNTAVIALISSLGLSEDEFVAKMNGKAKELGLANTSFKDATGLDARNVSTVKDIAILAKKAMVRKDIREAALTDRYEFKTLAGRTVSAVSTDSLLTSFPENGSKLLGGKTGYIPEAGYCFVGSFIDHGGRGVITVVFGAKTDASRFKETKKMADWAFSSFDWKVAN